MKPRNVTKIMCLIVAGVVTTGSLFAAQTDDRDFQAEASRLLKEVQSTATVLNRDAVLLHSFTRGGMTWESHVEQVSLVKEHINTMGKYLDRLQEIRHEATLGQQQAINSVVPAALILAAHTESAIEHLNDRDKPLWDENYENHLRGISGRSGQVKQVVDLHLDIANTQDKLERLQGQTRTLGS